MNSRILVAIALSLLLCLAALAQAGEPVLVVGVESQYYRPYYWTDQDGFHSAAREILDAFARSAGIRFQYQPLPVRRLYEEYLDGEVDFKFPDNPQWKRELKKGRKIAYSLPLMNFIDGVMVRPERKGKGLAGLKVLGTVLGFTAWDYLDLVRQGRVRLVENASLSGLLEQVMMGRIDGAYVNPAVASYHLRHTLKKPGVLVFDPGLPHTRSSYLVSSFKHPRVIAGLNRFLTREKGLVQAIRERYGVPSD